MKNSKWTEDELEFLKDNYPNHGGTYCAEKLDRTLGSIHTKCYLLKIKPNKETLKRINREAQLKYNEDRPNSDFNVNVEQFLDIKTPEVAYFLGFLWADGYIVRQELRLIIVTVDMNNIKHTLNKLGKWNYNERVREGNKPICSAITGNKRLFEFLLENDYKIKSGASANKILSKISDDLKHYFFRGLIDGDGCIDKGGLSISSNYVQNWEYVSSICSNLSINSYIYRKVHKSGKYSTIEMNGINGLIFAEYVYQNREFDNIGLYRKYLKYLELKDAVENGRNYVANEKKTVALEMFSNGVPITKIMKELAIAGTTVRRYLKSEDSYEEIQSTHRITEEYVLHIRSLYIPNSNIAEIYKLYSNKISMSGFRKICTKKSWKHL